MKALIKILFITMVLLSCGSRKSNIEVAKSVTDIQTDSETKAIADNSEKSNNSEKVLKENESTEHEVVKQTVEKFDKDGNVIERKTIETNKSKKKKGKQQKHKQESKSNSNKSDISEKTDKSEFSETNTKNKVVNADKTLATNFGGWASLLFFCVLAIAGFIIYKRFLK